ncbi:histamine H2 receptor [Pelodytes ibericus]
MCSPVMGDDLKDAVVTCWRTILYNVLIGVVLVLIIIMTICGNVVVCLAVGFDRRLRSMTNCFIVSLAITDLLLGILVLPFSALNLLQEEWPFGATFCNIYTSLDVMLCTASILNLFMISLDRYYGVTAPLQYSMFVTPCRVGVAMGVIWIVSLMVSFLPIHLGWNTKDKTIQNSRDDDHKECKLELNKEYVLVDGLLTFYLPLFIMCLMYYRIFKIAREQAKRINHANCSNAVSPSLPTVREHKATVTLAAVMGAFIICWFPYFTVFTYQGVNDIEVDETAFLIVLWLGYANSALNPILYAALNRDFRTAYQRLLHCRRVGPLSQETPLTLLHIRRPGEARTQQEIKIIPEDKPHKLQETNGKEGSPFIGNTEEREQRRLCNKCLDFMTYKRGPWLLNLLPKGRLRNSMARDTVDEAPDGTQMSGSGIVLSTHFPNTTFSE